MTDIYRMTIRMLLFNHNRESFSHKELEKLKSTHMYEPFETFPEELQNIFNILGENCFQRDRRRKTGSLNQAKSVGWKIADCFTNCQT